MCGIVGQIRFDRKDVKKETLQSMLKTIKHRGPDDEGVYVDGAVGLGQVRLSILDLSAAGHQPMTDATGRYTIIQNGESYNYIELREELKALGYSFKSETDTEVVLNGYIEWGEAVLERLNGMFAMAIYDKVAQTVFLARDRFGVKPFYYYVDGELMVFASEIPAILEVLGTKPKANEDAIFDYLVFNRTDQTEETFFEGIYKLQHGCCMLLDLSGTKTQINTADAAINTDKEDNQKNYKKNTESSTDTDSILTVTAPQSACEQAPRQTDDPFRSTDIDSQYPLDDSEKNTKNNFIPYTKENLPIRRWYSLADQVESVKCKVESLTEEEAKEKFMELFEKAVRLRLRTDVPWGVCLSGGLDSSAITATIIKVLKEKDVHSFSAVYGKDSEADESQYIDEFKGIVPNMHYIYPDADRLFAHLDDYVRIQGEPTPTTSPYALYCVLDEAKKYVKVVIDGQGSDEALAGYEYIPGLYYKTLFTHLRWGRLAKEIIQYAKLHKSWRHVKYMAFFLLPSRMRTRVRVAQRGYINPAFVAKHKDSVIADKLYGANTMTEMLVNHFEYKLEHLCKWGDRDTMAFGMEGRSPFLDKDLVEYSIALQDKMKIRGGYTKFILREVMKGIMPEKVRLRVDKRGFAVPQDDWMRTEKFQKLVIDILQSELFASRGYFVPEEAMKLYQRHLSGEINISKDIWKWINLELWFRKYID